MAVPIVVAVLAVSVMKLSVLTALIPLLVLAGTAIFLPFGQGSSYMTRLVRDLHPNAAAGKDSFIVQLTLSPRMHSGLRAIFEDADDIGYLTFTESALCYQGDAVQLFVPLNRIARVYPQDIGLRGLFVYGRRIAIVVPSLPNITSLEFAERSSLLLPASRRITKQLHSRLLNK